MMKVPEPPAQQIGKLSYSEASVQLVLPIVATRRHACASGIAWRRWAERVARAGAVAAACRAEFRCQKKGGARKRGSCSVPTASASVCGRTFVSCGLAGADRLLRRRARCKFLVMGGGKVARRHASPKPPRQRSVIVLWDIENCNVPSGMSGSDAVSAIRRWVEYNGWPSQPPELHVVTAYNIFSSRVHQNFWNQLKHAGVEQIAAGPKHESADRELEQRMRQRFRLPAERGRRASC